MICRPVVNLLLQETKSCGIFTFKVFGRWAEDQQGLSATFNWQLMNFYIAAVFFSILIKKLLLVDTYNKMCSLLVLLLPRNEWERRKRYKHSTLRTQETFPHLYFAILAGYLTFKRRIKSHLPFAGIIRSSPYSPRFQDEGQIEIV